MTETLHRVADVESVRQGDAPERTSLPVERSEVGQTVGERLAAARARKGLSIEEVSARLKVSPVKLRALERDDLALLPETAFLLGIVRSYANVVGLDAAPLVELLRRVRGDGPVELAAAAFGEVNAGRRARVELTMGSPRSPKRPWGWLAVVAVALIALLAAWHAGDEPTGWLARLRADAPDSTATRGASVTVATDLAGIGPNGASSALSTPATSASEAVAAAAAVSSALAPGSVTPLATAPGPVADSAQATQGAMQSAAGEPTGANAAAASAGASANAPANGSGMLQMTVSQQTWLGVRERDGKSLFAGMVSAGATQSIQGAAPLDVVIGNVAGLNTLQWNGKLVDLTPYRSAHGNVAHMTLQ